MCPSSVWTDLSADPPALLAAVLRTTSDRQLETTLCSLLIEEVPHRGGSLARIAQLTAKHMGANLADEAVALASAYAAYAQTRHGPILLQALESLADRVLRQSNGIERLHLLEKIWSSARSSLKTYGYLRTCLLDASLDEIYRAYPDEQIPTGDICTWIALAQVALRGGEGADAFAILDVLDKRDPDNPFVREFLANAHVARGDFAAADVLYRKLEDDYVWPAGLIRLADASFGADIDSPRWDEPPDRFSWIPCGNIDAKARIFVVGIDDRYAQRYLPDLIDSLTHTQAESPWLLHAHLVNPTQETLNWIAARQHAGTPVAATVESVPFRETEIVGTRRVVEMRTYYACARFRMLPHLLAHYAQPLWVIDADMRALRPVHTLLEEAGYGAANIDAGIVPLNERARCLTEYVWLSLSYYAPSPETQRFTQVLARYLNRQLAHDLWGWGLDQAAFFAVLAWSERHTPSFRVARLPYDFIADRDVQHPQAYFTSRVASLE